MEERIQLQVITAAGTVYDGPVSLVRLPLSGGSIGVLPRHAPLLGALEGGVVKYTRADGSAGYIAVGQGVVHVTGSEVVVLARTAELAENIDMARAAEAERRARARLARRQEGVDVVRAEAALHRSLVRQKACRLMGGSV